MSDKPKIKFWEYLWYAWVTLFLMMVGLVLMIFAGLRSLIGLAGRPRLSWRIAAVFILAIVVLGGAYIYYRYTHVIDLGTNEVTLVVKPGDRLSTIVERLYAQGVVNTKVFLKLPARWLKLDTRLIPGEYRFTGKNSARSVLLRLAKGEGVQVRLTIVEGLPVWKVASQLKEQLGIDSALVIGMCHDSILAASLGVPSFEGYLYPETYLIAPGTDARTALSTMVKMFITRTSGIWADTVRCGLSKAKTMILASIIQAEAKLPAEAPQIASVYLNRLRLGMNLDADPTVSYGLGGPERALTREDLEQPSPYNTYKNFGLPPTPINSPGMQAIMAALHPETTNYLYFVADGSGGHIFSRTNAEHNEARRRARILQRLNQKS